MARDRLVAIFNWRADCVVNTQPMRSRRTIGGALTTALLAAACSGAPNATPGEPSESIAQQEQSLRTFAEKAEATGATVTWRSHRSIVDGSHHLHVAAKDITLPEGASTDERVVSLLEQNIGAFSPRLAPQPFRVRSVTLDRNGKKHVRLQQTAYGLPVDGGEVVVHLAHDETLTSIDAHTLPHTDRAPTISISNDTAQAIAVATVDGAGGIASTDLLLVQENDVLVPVYRVLIDAYSSSAPHAFQIDIDAAKGTVRNSIDILQTVAGTGIGVFGAKRDINVTQSGTSFQLIDRSRGSEIDTYSAEQGTTLPGKLITSPQRDVWDTTAPAGAGAAVDAHYFAGVVYDYYKSHHARKGIDGNDGAMISTVHFSVQYDNAFWSPAAKQMGYGDGGVDLKPLPAALDVIAHEFTHGVTQATAKLTYQDATGALNESISDIFAAFIEHTYQANENDNFLIGELIGKSGPLRNMVHPADEALQYPQRDHMQVYFKTKQDNGGIHINSGIPNNAMALMTVGGTNDVSKVQLPRGLGWDKSEKIWYHALTNFFMSSDDFETAATKTIAAAEDLGLPETDRNVVECAWIAVGVLSGECKSMEESTDSQTATGGNPSGTANKRDGGAEEAKGGPLNLRAGQGDSSCAFASSAQSSTTSLLGAFAAAATLLLGRRRRRSSL